jgi:hypothetical protein
MLQILRRYIVQRGQQRGFPIRAEHNTQPPYAIDVGYELVNSLYDERILLWVGTRRTILDVIVQVYPYFADFGALEVQSGNFYGRLSVQVGFNERPKVRRAEENFAE